MIASLLPAGGPTGNPPPEDPPSGDRTGVYLSPTTVPFYTFDEDYLKRFRASDPETTSHFYGYFTQMLHTKLRNRGLPQHVIDDLVQETFLRALRTIMADKVRVPAGLGAYMSGVCKNVLHEHRRDQHRSESMNGDDYDIADEAADLHRLFVLEENKTRVWNVLARMKPRDRAFLTAAIIEDRDKDEICREYGVDRDYLRVLLHRALQIFKNLYKKH